MDFSEVLARCRPVRRFEARPVEAETLQAIFDATAAAPSAGGLQAYEIVALTGLDAGQRLALDEIARGQECLESAPALLVFCADGERGRERHGERGASLFALQDATVAAAYAELAATALGLGSCWVETFDEDVLRSLLRLPARLRPVAVIAIGHAAEQPDQVPRRSADGLVRKYA